MVTDAPVTGLQLDKAPTLVDRIQTLEELAAKPVVTLRDLAAYDVVPPPIAGKVLTLGRNAAYDACRRGEIPSLRVGGRVLVPVAALRRMLEGAAEDAGGGR